MIHLTINLILMKKIILFILLLFFINTVTAQETVKDQVNKTLDAWHKAASEANYKNYFDLFTDDAIFAGTDATENWTKGDFQAYAKPYFDQGKAWSFICLERHIYFNDDKTIAWFDELLNTRMKICRGSGVLFLNNGSWKIKHYILSLTIPNETVDDVVKIKSAIEENLIIDIKNKRK